MRNRHKLGKSLVASALGLAVLAGVAAPAQAADTTATFTLTAAGGLSISAPESKALGSAATGASAVAGVQLGAVTVTDQRGALLGAWTATADSTDYTTGEASANETIADDNADYWSGPATASSGTAVRVPGQVAAANKVTFAAARTAFSASGVVGNGSTTWNPTVSINLPSTAVAGSYSGTITHSVA